MNDPLLDIKEVAAYLQMNKMTVYKLAREGKIPAFKVASEWRFRKDLIDAWLMSQVKEDRQIPVQEVKSIPSDRKPLKPLSEFGGEALAVLVVDDEPMIRDLFVKLLQEHHVETAASGEEALGIIAHRRPNVVLLDFKMPGMDGLETLRRIKQVDDSIAVIMLSAFATLDITLEAVRLGAYTSMAKPFDPSDIRRTIQAAADYRVSAVK